MRAPRPLLELGRGGAGVVHLARLPRDDRDDGVPRLVVVKRLHPDLAAHPESRAMFLREAQLLSRLAHPNVVQPLDAGFDGDDYFLVMEWLDGQPLSAFARARLDVPLLIGVSVLREALAGLHAAHELREPGGPGLGLVHRDVSPHNVFVTYEGAVKVLDFGVAQTDGGVVRTRTGVLRGTPAYMAPEQAASERVDRRADVFAVGVMLWELLAGRRLWGDRSEREILAALRRREIAPPPPRDGAASGGLQSLCARALAAEPADRFATADAMGRALDAWLAETGPAPTAADRGAFVVRHFSAQRSEMARRIAGAVSLGADSAPALNPVLGFSATYSLAAASARSEPARRSTAAGRPARTSLLPLVAVAALGLAVGSVLFGDPAGTEASPLLEPASSAPAPGAKPGTESAEARTDRRLRPDRP